MNITDQTHQFGIGIALHRFPKCFKLPLCTNAQSLCSFTVTPPTDVPLLNSHGHHRHVAVKGSVQKASHHQGKPALLEGVKEHISPL